MRSNAREIVLRDTAKADILEVFIYLATKASAEVADSFLDALEIAWRLLETFPSVGIELSGYSSDIRTLRRWPVPKFTNYLVYYRLHASNVDILRVLHGSRDIRMLIKDC